jgi:RNA-directed DNA polymerase
MALGSLIKQIFDRMFYGKGLGVENLARRLRLSVAELRAVRPSYRAFSLPKRSGGTRQILAPEARLKAVQRRILRRLLARLRCHPAATGFERGQSIVTNARAHVGQAVVVQMDIRDFFASTRSARVRQFFRRIGWNRPAANLLVRLCTHEGGLPQGAPTSPRLSNLVNVRLDARLTGLAALRRFRGLGPSAPAGCYELRATYTRYADDLTFSFPSDDPKAVRYLIHWTKAIVASEGYVLHRRKKLYIRRRHDRQQVTGLVVNEHVNLPRTVRRWLRAVEHHVADGRPATLTAAQLAGWRALRRMVAQNGGTASRGP